MTIPWWSLLLAVWAAGLLGFFLGRHRVSTAPTTQRDGPQQPQELKALQELSLSLSESLELDHIVDRVVHHLTHAVAVDGALIAVANGSEPPLRVLAARGSVSDLAGTEIPEQDGGLVGEAMGMEHLQVAHAEVDQIPELVRGRAVQTAAVAPLCAHGITMGALAIVRDSIEPFRATDLKQLTTVATHAAVVLENARLFSLVDTGKRQWEATFDALHDGITVLDGEDRIRRANKALAGMVGQPIPAVIDLPLFSVLTGDQAGLRDYLGKVRSGDGPAAFTFVYEPSKRTLRVGAATLPGAGEGWVVALIEDVTERRAMEAQLIQSEKMAAVGQLVSGIAHELNNPLSSIAGVSDLLLSRESTHESEKPHLSLIHEQAERASHIVRNLLTFARKEPVGTENIDLNEIAESVASLIRHELKLRDVELDLELTEPGPAVQGSRHELQQVVLNLLTNAIQAVATNPDGRARVVRVVTAYDGDNALLTVSDSGPGIPEELASQVFLPFFTTKPAGEGTGLGLSISYHIVESHGGTISVLPSLRGGTQMDVSLPIATGAAAFGSGEADHAQPTQAEASRTLGRILLLERDVAVRRSLALLLTGDGHMVHPVVDMREALDLIERNDYDLILAEPETNDGDLSVFRLPLEDQPGMSRKTLLITADVRPEMEEWLRSTGCRYLHKPVSAEALRAAVEEILVENRGSEV